nr:MAG TPA: hypothetical protein [Caudoviricetes sp.]
MKRNTVSLTCRYKLYHYVFIHDIDISSFILTISVFIELE